MTILFSGRVCLSIWACDCYTWSSAQSRLLIKSLLASPQCIVPYDPYAHEQTGDKVDMIRRPRILETLHTTLINIISGGSI